MITRHKLAGSRIAYVLHAPEGFWIDIYREGACICQAFQRR